MCEFQTSSNDAGRRARAGFPMRAMPWGVVACAAFPGCAGSQSAIDPAGPQAERILSLANMFLGTCVVVYLVFLIVLGLAMLARQPRPGGELPEVAPRGVWSDWIRGMVIAAAVGVSALLLSVLLMSDVSTLHAMQETTDDDPLTITVTGRQWWWEVRYEADPPSRQVVTANEIHLPVGRQVRFDLKSADVIHSFWVPNLHGKRDLVPGHPTSLLLQADRPGVYHGQCAEFCGLQHALMRFVVVVESPERFEAWLETQRQPAGEPETEEQRRGRDVFLSKTCIMCHAVRGTGSHATVGPDLTHLGSRRTLAAGALPNTRGHLAGWITDPQQLKAGARMPQHTLSSRDLRDLVAWLESLK